MSAETLPADASAQAVQLGPHVRLAMLRLSAQARSIRQRLSSQAEHPGVARRSWPSLRAALADELEHSMERILNSLRALHDDVFPSAELVLVQDIRRRAGALSAHIGHLIGLHREIAAALPPENPLRASVLAIVERPLLELATFFETMQRAVESLAAGAPSGASGIELRLAIELDFAAQLASAESASAPAAERS